MKCLFLRIFLNVVDRNISQSLQELKSQTCSRPKLFGNLGFVTELRSCLPTITQGTRGRVVLDKGKCGVEESSTTYSV